MFKSIFGKYLTTFTVILVTCIAAVLIAVGFVISDDERSNRIMTMENVAGSTVAAIEGAASDMMIGEAGRLVLSSEGIKRLIGVSADNIGAEIYVFGAGGELISYFPETAEHSGDSVGAGVFVKMLTAPGAYAVSTLDGFFDGTRVNIYRAGKVGPDDFVILVSSVKTSSDVMGKRMVLVAVTVALWVFLASMISLYVISLRTTKPLSQIVSAAKDYAKGRFDRKIEVSGQDEVAELAKAINDMAESLSGIEEARNSFIGNVSHDLRTPMTTISGFVDGILDGTIPEEKHEYYLNVISQEVRRLSRLVNSLLEMSRQESGASLEPTRFNLTEKARTVLISLESKINDKKLDIEFDGGEEDVFVFADDDSIHRAIFNLTDNAVKFTPEGGKITVRVGTSADGRKKKKAVFTIRNTGEGIPKDELPHVFERFYKTDRSRGLDKSGTGLGLYIAKTALVNHGEDLTVESAEGEYTEFRFTLPLSDD